MAQCYCGTDSLLCEIYEMHSEGTVPLTTNTKKTLALRTHCADDVILLLTIFSQSCNILVSGYLRQTKCCISTPGRIVFLPVHLLLQCFTCNILETARAELYCLSLWV